MGRLSRLVRGGRRGTAGPHAHAVVMGAGMAGLLAARVLADHFEQVTMVDRDRFPDGPGFRRGVPQSRHLHVLLSRGLECLEQLFPGFEGDLVAAGVPVVEGSESLWLNAPAGAGATSRRPAARPTGVPLPPRVLPPVLARPPHPSPAHPQPSKPDPAST
jgi:hypothetical protein